MTRVVVLALDGVPPSVLFDDAFAPRLPVLSALRRSGFWGELRSVFPAITVPAWACAMTSRDPGELGIYGFRNRRDRSYGAMSVVTSAAIDVPTVWDVLGAEGRSVAVIGLPPGYPPRAVRGEWIGCFLTPGTEAPYTWPRELKSEVARVVGRYVFDIEGVRSNDKARIVTDARTMTERRWTFARHLLRTRDPDVLILHEIGPDRIHHALWRHHDPTHPAHDPTSEFRDAVLGYYELLDREIGSLLELVPDAYVVIASDHGCKPMRGGILVNQWLIDQGHLRLRATPQTPRPLRTDDVDWQHSMAWAEGGYYARVWLNVRGREAHGSIAPGDVDRVADEIATGFRDLADDEGRPMRTIVRRPASTYRAVRGIAPDLMVYFDDLDWRSVATVGARGWYTHENDTGPDDANHSEDGVVIVAGPGVRPARGRGSLLDLGPTILALAQARPLPGGAGIPLVSP